MPLAVRQIFLYDSDRKFQKRPTRKKCLKKYNDCSNSVQVLFLECLRTKTQELMEKSEQLFRLITHVCAYRLNGVLRSSVSCPWKHTECLSVLHQSSRVSDDFEGYNTRQGKVLHRPEESLSIFSYLRSFSRHKYEENYSSSLRSCEDDGGGSIICRNRIGRESLPLSSTNKVIHKYLRKEDPSSSGLKGSGAGPPLSSTSFWKLRGGSSIFSSKRAAGWPFFNTFSVFFLLLVSSIFGVTESCSSRSTPKPRPASATLRPNVTFPTYACPPAYAAWFCLNGATCFTVKIQDAILYNCECAEGYMGPRCEFKDLDGSYLPARERVLLETASIAGGACIAIVLVFVVLFAMYVFLQKDKEKIRNQDDPYYDKKPLKSIIETDYICTITPIRVPNRKPQAELSCEKFEEENRDYYILEGLHRCPAAKFCPCEVVDCVGHHVMCSSQRLEKFVVVPVSSTAQQVPQPQSLHFTHSPSGTDNVPKFV